MYVGLGLRTPFLNKENNKVRQLLGQEHLAAVVLKAALFMQQYDGAVHVLYEPASDFDLPRLQKWVPQLRYTTSLYVPGSILRMFHGGQDFCVLGVSLGASGDIPVHHNTLTRTDSQNMECEYLVPIQFTCNNEDIHITQDDMPAPTQKTMRANMGAALICGVTNKKDVLVEEVCEVSGADAVSRLIEDIHDKYTPQVSCILDASIAPLVRADLTQKISCYNTTVLPVSIGPATECESILRGVHAVKNGGDRVVILGGSSDKAVALVLRKNHETD